MNNHGNLVNDRRVTHRGMDQQKGVIHTSGEFSPLKRPEQKKLPASNQHVVILLGLASTVRGRP